MKQLFTLLFFSLLIFSSHISKAVTITIDVKNNFFDADFVTATVGDVIHFEWTEGTHTTTSDTVPTGAQSWNAPMDANNQDFSYTIAVAGHYHYFCMIHGQMMSGTIEAGATGILSLGQGNENLIAVNGVNGNNISIHYQYLRSQATTISLYSLAGNRIQILAEGMQPAGDYIEDYRLNQLPGGIYFILVQAGNLKLARKISIQ